MRQGEEFVMIVTGPLTYEKIYYALWENAQRYSRFTQFRVIGKSHDDRMIPMLEIGTGQDVIFCLAGLDGCDRRMSTCLVEMIQEYCRAYECGWILDEEYKIRDLLDEVRICFIPVLNPDGYEICEKGFTAIRNPIYRQMLRMMESSSCDFAYNARGMDIRRNFPTSYCSRERIHQEPASENETKALIRIFQEYKSVGLLSFCHLGKRIVYFRQPQAFAYNQRSYRLARHLQKRSCYRLEKAVYEEKNRKKEDTSGSGTPEQFYAEITRQPALMIETPDFGNESEKGDVLKKDYQDIHTLPLEYIFSLNN